MSGSVAEPDKLGTGKGAEFLRILHTADWHLGKTLEERDRREEQEAFVDEICALCREEKIDLVLLAGDVFQTPNPGAAAQDLFFDAMDRLAEHGRRAVVAIAGNHDSPERLAAPAPLADKLGISLLGYPHEVLTPTARLETGMVRRVNCGASWLELAVPGVEHSAVIAALPYPSEGRLKRLLSAACEETELQRGYNECLKEIFGRLQNHYRPDAINLLVSHLYVRNCIESDHDTELDIQMGGAYAVDPAVLDIGAQYVALGHLHRPQKVSGCGGPARYAGSPLAYGFAEAGYAKSVMLVNIRPGMTAELQEVPLSASRPLVRWRATGGLAEVHRWIDAGKDAEAWIDLEICLTDLLSGSDIHRLRELRPRIVGIRPVTPASASQTERLNLAGLPVSELFARFYAEKTGGLQPDSELLRLFGELIGETEAAEATEEVQQG